MNEPLYPNALIGYKALEVNKAYHAPHNDIVTSPYHDEIVWWKDGKARIEQMAKCDPKVRPPVQHDRSIAPWEDCSCGCWAYNSVEAAIGAKSAGPPTAFMRAAKKAMRRHNETQYIIALVFQYGLFYVNEITSRAEFQRIAAICSDSPADKDLIERVAKEMKVPLMTLEELVDYGSYAGMQAS